MLRSTVAVCALSAVNADRENSDAAANPIRRVVNLLQSMQKKVEAEGEKQKSVHQKYMCYCQTAGGNLQGSIEAASSKAPQVESSIREAQGAKAQLEQELKDHQASRSDAKSAMAQATAIRAKEAASFAKESGDYKANIAALGSAVKALESGMAGGSFLQGGAAKIVQKLAVDMDMGSYDRQVLVSFLSGKSTEGYAPQSGQITGILKEMQETMSKDLAEITATEAGSIKTFDGLMSARSKEIDATTKAIESKTQRVGQLGVDIAAMKNDLSDTEAALMQDKDFLANMDATCADKTSLFDVAVALRAQELLAIAETIKVLNDDDALDLFKKTLSGPSLLQVVGTSSQLSHKALAIVRHATVNSRNEHSGLDLIALALTGKKVNFDKVLGLIDKLVGTLHQEQVNDDRKKEYCGLQMDTSDDKKKGLQMDVSDLEKLLDATKDKIATLADELKALADGLSVLDKEVAEQTETRKEEHQDYTELTSQNLAAKQLLGIAKNRLNKFYNPKLYNPPAKRVLSEDQSITLNFGGTLAPTAAPGGIAGTGVTALVQLHSHKQVEAPPPPPVAVTAYTNKGQMNNGVVALLDRLIADLDKEVQEAEVTEKDSQQEYEQFMKEAASKRVVDSKAVTNKEEAKANAEGTLEQAKENQHSKTKELMATEQYIASLHAECDWLVANFDLRKEARAGEVDSLKKAKAVLAGADFSLMQVSVTKAKSLPVATLETSLARQESAMEAELATLRQDEETYLKARVEFEKARDQRTNRALITALGKFRQSEETYFQARTEFEAAKVQLREAQLRDATFLANKTDAVVRRTSLRGA